MTRAPHLIVHPSDVLVRFSNGSPDPTTPDTAPGIRGMAVRILLPNGEAHDLVASNLRVFATRRPGGFVDLTEVLGKIDPHAKGVRRLAAGAATAGRFMAFVAKHPESRAAMAAFGKLRPGASFATTRFDGIHAFWLVAGDGSRTPFRFHFAPAEGEADLHEDSPPRLDQFLIDELEERVAGGGATFDLVFQLGGTADPTNDPTKLWPSDRRMVVAGRVVLKAPAPDADALEQEVFDPTRVPDGLELSDDSVLRFRGEVYRLSAERRRRGG
jgi:catalase